MASYKLTADTEEITSEVIADKPAQKTEEPALKQIIHKQPVPVSQGARPKSKGLISRLFGSLFGVASEEETSDSRKKELPKNRKRTRQRQRPHDRNTSQSGRSSKSGNRKPGSRRRNTSGDKQRNRQGNRNTRNVSESSSRQSSQGNSSVPEDLIKQDDTQEKLDDIKPENTGISEIKQQEIEIKPPATGDNVNYSDSGESRESYQASDITENN